MTTSVTLPAGVQTLTIDQDNGGWNVHYLTFAASGGAAFGGTPAAVPGTVQAANYDTGGQGVAYNVTSVNGNGTSYRSDGVDLETTADTQDTTPAGGPYDLGWTATGQWFKYTVNVATAGTYTVSLRLASPSGVTDALHIANSAGTSLSSAVAAPDTGGWQTWTTVTTSVTLPAGAANPHHRPGQRRLEHSSAQLRLVDATDETLRHAVRVSAQPALGAIAAPTSAAISAGSSLSAARETANSVVSPAWLLCRPPGGKSDAALRNEGEQLLVNRVGVARGVREKLIGVWHARLHGDE